MKFSIVIILLIFISSVFANKVNRRKVCVKSALNRLIGTVDETDYHLVRKSDETYQFTISDVGTGNQKNYRARFLERNSWGQSSDLADINFILAIPVNDKEEGLGLIKQIANTSNFPGRPEDYIPQPGKVAVEFDDKVSVSVFSTNKVPGGISSAYELRITLNEGASIETGESIIRSLFNDLQMKPISTDEIIFDFSTNSGRREWASYTFQDWKNQLTSEEIVALRSIAGSSYKDIQSVARGGNASDKLNNVVKNIDNAIEKGKTDRDITLFRAVRHDIYENAWKSLQQSHSVEPINIQADPGFIFSSLDPEVADWWNSSQLDGKGIMLEIQTPKGTNAAFIDMQGIETDRGYLEVLLERDISYQAVGARQRSDGTRVLEVIINK